LTGLPSASKLPGVPVSVRHCGRRHAEVSSATVRRRARRMLQALSLTEAELSVVLCDDAVMRELNLQYRKQDRTTDVLAFAMSEGPRMPAMIAAPLGDVVISVPTAARQARAAGKRTLEEITMLLAHGLLHLLGFDHRTADEERRMRARTDALVSAALGSGARPPAVCG
jgi:probable rRNA maturation factor